MQRQGRKGQAQEGRGQIRAEIIGPERSDAGRLSVILASGFGVAGGYSSLNRDRYHLELCDGVTAEQLLGFCQDMLKGAPMPRADPIADGPKLLGMFREAEKAGLIRLHFVEAAAFVPERRE